MEQVLAVAAATRNAREANAAMAAEGAFDPSKALRITPAMVRAAREKREEELVANPPESYKRIVAQRAQKGPMRDGDIYDYKNKGGFEKLEKTGTPDALALLAYYKARIAVGDRKAPAVEAAPAAASGEKVRGSKEDIEAVRTFMAAKAKRAGVNTSRGYKPTFTIYKNAAGVPQYMTVAEEKDAIKHEFHDDSQEVDVTRWVAYYSDNYDVSIESIKPTQVTVNDYKLNREYVANKTAIIKTI